MLDAPTPAALIDDGDLQRVRAGRIAEDEPGVFLGRVGDGCLDVVVDLAVDEPSLLVHQTVGECQPAVGAARAIDLGGHQDAQLVARGIP